VVWRPAGGVMTDAFTRLLRALADRYRIEREIGWWDGDDPSVAAA
jgi:hypothetical protein